jgi:Leucine Rich repeat
MAEGRRRWFTYGSRSLFVMVAVLAMCLAWWIRPAREQEAIIAKLREYDGRATVVYDDEYAGESTASFPFVIGPIDFRPRAWMPSFLQSRLGKDFLYVVLSVGSPRFSRSANSKEVLRCLAQLPRLNHLTFNADVDDADVACLTPLRRLEKLELGSCPQLTDEGLAQITKIGKLQRLAVRNGAFTDHGLVHLQKLTELTSLVLGEAFYPDGAVNISDEGLRHLACVTKLESLELSSTKLTGAGLSELASLTRLTALRLKCPLLSDRELPALVSMKGLQSLVLEQSQVAGPGLASLTGLSKLSLLSLHGYNITDEAIPFLATFPMAVDFEFIHTRVSKVRINQLQSSRAKSAVIWNPPFEPQVTDIGPAQGGR